MRMMFAIGIMAGVATGSPAQTTESAVAAPADTTAARDQTIAIPVFPNDIVDRPYTIVGEVTAKVRKATIFSNEASQDKIYRELWERARKLGADAVVKAKYGDSHVTAMSWGSTTATGTAIKFTAPAPPPSPGTN